LAMWRGDYLSTRLSLLQQNQYLCRTLILCGMKKRFSSRQGPNISQHSLKAKIVDKVREGVFDRNPLLATPHTVECKNCGCAQRITYLEFLRAGRFVLGKTRTIEVAYDDLTFLGVSYTTESVTPILIRIRCEKCAAEITCCPTTLEYLMFTARKRVESEQIYV